MRRLNPARLSSLRYRSRARIRPLAPATGLHPKLISHHARLYSTPRIPWTFFSDEPDKSDARPRGDPTSTLRYILAHLSSPRRPEVPSDAVPEKQVEREDLPLPFPNEASSFSRSPFDLPPTDRSTETFRKRLMSLAPDYQASYTDLYHLFSYIEQLDQPSVILATRLLIPAIPRIDPDRYSTMVGRCLERMYELHMLVAMEPLLLAFLEDIKSIARNKHARPQAVYRWYGSILSRLFRIPPHQIYDRQIRRQVEVLLQHLSIDLDQIPGGVKGHPIPRTILEQVLHPRLVSAAVREMVIARAERNGIQLDEYQWSLCIASAVKDRDATAIERYFEAMQRGRNSELEPRDEVGHDSADGVAEDLGDEIQSTAETVEDGSEGWHTNPPTRNPATIPTSSGRPPTVSTHKAARTAGNVPPKPTIPWAQSFRPLVSPSPTHGRHLPARRPTHDTPWRNFASLATAPPQTTSLARSPPDSQHRLVDHIPSLDSAVPAHVTRRVKILLTQQSGELEQLYDNLEPLLTPPDTTLATYPHDLEDHQSAWSSLFHGLAITPKVTADDLLGLWTNMPESAKSSYCISPLMQGLIRRHRHDLSWKAWNNYVQFVARTPSFLQSSYIDARNIIDATTACADLGFDEQIAFLDYWAKRPNSLENKSSTFEHSVEIDAFNINELMISCRKARSPSVALRLWAAAGPRWGVKLDSASLSILLDTTRLYEDSKRDPRSDETMRTQLKLFFADLSASRLFHSSRDEDLGELGESKFGAYEADGFSKGGHGVLLDPPGFYWHQTHGTIRPWEIGKAIFRQVVLGNFPHLSRVVNPLDPNVKWNGDSWYARYFGDTPKDAKIQLVDRLPLPTAKYMHLTPDAMAWSSYIRLLGYFGHVNQIPLALAWMKELGVKPTWVSMVYALAYLKDGQGEPRTLNGQYTSDEEIVRDFLLGWLGEGKEPAHSFGFRGSEHHRSRSFHDMPSGVDEDGRRWKVPSPEDVMALRQWFMGTRIRFHHRE